MRDLDVLVRARQAQSGRGFHERSALGIELADQDAKLVFHWEVAGFNVITVSSRSHDGRVEESQLPLVSGSVCGSPSTQGGT